MTDDVEGKKARVWNIVQEKAAVEEKAALVAAKASVR
jgi:hypothetical protein